MVVNVKDAETKRNKARVAHTGWNKSKKTSTVIAENFVRDLISYISYFWLKVRNLVAYESYARIPVYVTIALAVRKFIAHESSRALEYEIFTRTKISAITVRQHQKRSVCNQVACNYFFNRKCANQRAIVQQENEIHSVTGLDA